MAEPDAGDRRPLGLLLKIGDEHGDDNGKRDEWWAQTLPSALEQLETDGARRMGLWRSTWSSDWHYFAVYEFAALPQLESGVAMLGRRGLFRSVRTGRLIGRRWGGEQGWDADKWKARDTHCDLGAILFYGITESLYTLTPEQMTARHGDRRRLLDAAISGLLARGGQRLGSYFCEWSSKWHLFVPYEFPDLAALEAFNMALPERHGYIDYETPWLMGRRLTSPAAITRP